MLLFSCDVELLESRLLRRNLLIEVKVERVRDCFLLTLGDRGKAVLSLNRRRRRRSGRKALLVLDDGLLGVLDERGIERWSSVLRVVAIGELGLRRASVVLMEVKGVLEVDGKTVERKLAIPKRRC